jgi:signal transduction histidine kinase/ActR/RegA family two-component response regulator
LPTPLKLRSLASKFFLLTAALVLWVVGVVLAYDLRQDTFDVRKGILLFLIVLLVAGAIARMTTRLLARPLELLNRGILAVRAGRLEPIQVSETGDEIEFVGESFNEMIAAFAATQQELLKNKELLEERIRQRTEELEVAMQSALAASKAKGEFLANISHELRTPMNGILGMINIVLETDLDREQRDHLETAQRCAYWLLAVLNDVLDLSKIEAGRMALESIPFDLRTVLEDSLKTHAAIAAQKKIALRTDFAPSLPARVEGDPLRLRQILSNLLSNAVKFTETGEVVLRARTVEITDDDCAQLEIKICDTGIGIPADKQQQIFDKFTQADSSISRRFGGTGLGLAITRSLIEMQNGTIAVESEPGAGSTFTVGLEYAVVRRKSHTADGGGGEDGPVRILVVEDNHVNQKLVFKILEKHGYDVVVADSGERALEALEQEEFHLVLMDVQMPMLDGLETTRLIRQNERLRGLPIVAMTARAMEGDKESCLEAGMNGFVSKPIHAAHLLSVVEEFSIPGPQRTRAASV